MILLLVLLMKWYNLKKMYKNEIGYKNIDLCKKKKKKLSLFIMLFVCI